MAESAVQSAAETLTYFLRQKDFYLSHVDVSVMSLRNKLKALLKDVYGMRGYNESVQLIEVANNTKNVIDSFISKIAQQRGETSAGLLSYQSTFNSGIKDKPAIEDLGKKIFDLKRRLDEILSNRSQYGIHNIQARGEASTSSNQSQIQKVKRAPIVEEAEVVGFEVETRTLVGRLIAGDMRRVVISSTATGGTGKTTLAKKVYDNVPDLKFAHFTANQAILEAFAGKSGVHVIDFSMKQGLQWPLMQALALRPGGPPAFRLTGIGPPQPDNTEPLQQVGWKLAQLAETIHIEFEYQGIVLNSLADLEPYMLNVRPGDVEAVAVNSVFELHPLLARPGAIDKVLATVKAVQPTIVTVVEQEANYNGPVFLDRFNEALHCYSTMFDSLEGCGMSPPNGQDQLMSEAYMGRQILKVMACEGTDRVERHETLRKWRGRMGGAGFSPVHLGSNACQQASMLLALFAGGDGYRVEENNGCLILGWHTRPLIATSAWHIVEQV